MKLSVLTLILATTMLSGTAAMAAGGLAKHDASIAHYSYSVPIIDSAGLSTPGTSLRDDIDKGYKPTPRPVAPAQPPMAPQAQNTVPAAKPVATPAPAPKAMPAPAPAVSQGGGAFSNVANGVAPANTAPAAAAPAVTNSAPVAAPAPAVVTPPSAIVPADTSATNNPTTTQNNPVAAPATAPTTPAPTVPADAALPSPAQSDAATKPAAPAAPAAPNGVTTSGVNSGSNM